MAFASISSWFFIKLSRPFLWRPLAGDVAVLPLLCAAGRPLRLSSFSVLWRFRGSSCRLSTVGKRRWPQAEPVASRLAAVVGQALAFLYTQAVRGPHLQHLPIPSCPGPSTLGGSVRVRAACLSRRSWPIALAGPESSVPAGLAILAAQPERSPGSSRRRQRGCQAICMQSARHAGRSVQQLPANQVLARKTPCMRLDLGELSRGGARNSPISSGLRRRQAENVKPKVQRRG